MSKMRVEIWSDIMCPFCYIGKRNFEKALSQFSNSDKVEVEWKSFQLDPMMPEMPRYHNDVYSFLADRKGMSYEWSINAHLHVSEMARKAGLEYNFDKVRVTNSLKGHRIIQFAKTKGLGEKAEETFFHAYFTRGENLNDNETLVELGKEIGLTEEEAREALTNPLFAQKVEGDVREAQAIGVRGVPFFLVNRKYAVVGAQPPDVFREMLEKAFAEWQKENPQPRLEVVQGESCATDGDCG